MRAYRNLPGILTLSMLVMAACTNSQTEPVNSETSATGTSVSEESTSVSPLELLPTEDFGGYEFKILAYDNAPEEHLAEEINGEPVNDAVFARNQYVEERYNVKISVTVQPHEEYTSTVIKNAMASEDAYDLYQVFLSYAAGHHTKNGYFLDWNIIPYVSENLHNPWWNQSSIDMLKVKGKNFVINGDICHLTLGNATGLFFNKNLFDAEKIEYPYQSVLDGTWTLDKLLSICQDQYRDLNGDSSMSFDDDQYAFMTSQWLAPIGIPIACDLDTLQYDDTGYPQLNLLTERAVSVYEKLYKLTVATGTPFHDYDAVVMNTPSFKCFVEDRALFIASSITNAASLRNMNSDFGIIPYPKYDEQQENYISSVDAGTTTAAVMVTASDTGRTGLIVEALCEKGSELVMPAFYKTLLQGKSARDDESLAMLDLIRETAFFDPLYVYNFNSMGFFFMDCLNAKTEDFASTAAAKESATVAAIEKFWDDLDNMNS